MANSAPTGASSTLRPPYMTTTRWAISATTPRLCVIRMIAAPVLDFSRRMMSRICACTVTSSAVVGSSAISSLGSQASAMAIMTRWRMPPDSSCGYCLRRWAGSGMPTRRSISIARASARRAAEPLMQGQRLGDLAADREHRVERRHRLLEDHRDVVAADVAHFPFGQVEQIGALEADRAFDDAAWRRGDEAHDRQRGDALAAARFTDHRERLAGATERRRRRRRARRRRA